MNRTEYQPEKALRLSICDGAFAAMMAVLAGGAFLNRWELAHGKEDPIGYLILFGVGIVLGLVSSAFLFLIPDPKAQDTKPAAAFRMAQFMGPFQDRNFRALVLYVGAFMFTTQLAGPFYAVYMIETLSIDFSTITWFITFATFASLFMLRIWGPIADEFGNKPILIVAGLAHALIPLSWVDPLTGIAGVTDLVSVNASRTTGVLRGWDERTDRWAEQCEAHMERALDLVLRRTGVQPFLEGRGIAMPPSRMVGWALYAVVLYSALVMAFQRVEFETGLALLSFIERMVPRLIVVVVLLGVGNLLGRWLGEMVQRAARVAGIPWYPLIGAAVRVAILVFVALISVRYLGLASDQLLLTGIAIIAVACLLAGFLVAFCARELVLNALAAKVYRSSYQPGDRIKIGDLEGDVVSVGPASVRLRTGTGYVQVPAALFTRGIVEHQPKED